jgi:hypothetical protein
MEAMRRTPAVVLLVLAAGCGTTSTTPPPAPAGSATAPPAAAPAPAPAPGATCPDDPASATADATLTAIVSQGEALAAHVGPEVAREMFADLERDPKRYLDRFECRYLAPTPQHGFDSLLLSVPLWHLRRLEPARVKRLAIRAVYRYEELSRTPPDPARDPYFAQRVRERIAAMSFIRDGLDVSVGPRWIAVPASAFESCITAAPDGTLAVRVTRTCSCGETLACRATAGRSGLDVAVFYDPDSPAMCTDCYGTSTSCTLPALPSAATLPSRCDLGP